MSDVKGAYALSFGYDDGSEREEWGFGSREDAVDWSDGYVHDLDCEEAYRCEWDRLRGGERERHRRRRVTLELAGPDGRAEELASYGYDELEADGM